MRGRRFVVCDTAGMFRGCAKCEFSAPQWKEAFWAPPNRAYDVWHSGRMQCPFGREIGCYLAVRLFEVSEINS